MSILSYIQEGLLSQESEDPRKKRLYENAVGDTMSALSVFGNDLTEEDEEFEDEALGGEEGEETVVKKNPTKSKSKSQNAIEQLKSGEDFATSPNEFRNSLMKSNHKEMLTDYDNAELSKMKLVKLPDMDVGYALKDFVSPDGKKYPNGELVAVHNNEDGVGGVGQAIMNHALKNGAMALDHFDVGILSNLYSANGFKEYERYPYDVKYDPNGKFKEKYGEVDVVYRMR